MTMVALIWTRSGVETTLQTRHVATGIAAGATTQLQLLRRGTFSLSPPMHAKWRAVPRLHHQSASRLALPLLNF